MKKFYTLLTLCFAFFGIATATAQDAPELSNEKCYTVKADRSSWVASTAGLKTLNDLGLNEDSTDPNQQFAFLTKDGATYLYSVGQAAFITKSGSLGAFATDPVYFTPSKDAGTFMVYFDDSHYINIGGSKQMAISNWKTGDIGNNYTFTEAGEFDPTSALASATPSAAISDLSELSNEKLYTVQQKNRGTSWAVASDAMVSSKQAGVVTGKENDPKQQFAFITSNETTYLYYAADKKFVNMDGSLSETPVDPIAFVNGASEGTFVVKFDDSHYVNVGGSGNMEINGWSTADDGNSNTITPVADFDPTEVLKLLAPAAPEAATVVSIDPACGHMDEGLPTTVTITFSGDIKAVEYGTIRTQLTSFRGYVMTENDYVIEGNKLTINVPAEYVTYQAQMQIRMNVVDANDQYVTYAYDANYETEGAIILEWTAPVKADVFEVESSVPAAGEVEKLDVITATFSNYRGSVVGGINTAKQVAVYDAAGEVVTTATMEVVQEDEWNTNDVTITLATPVTVAGEYTLIIPEATVFDEMFDPYAEDFGIAWGALYNPEIRIAYTVTAPAAPATVVAVDPACGYIETGMPTTFKVTFSEEVASIGMVMYLDNTTQMMGMQPVAPENYTLAGKELTLNLESISKDKFYLILMIQATDANGNAVTYSYNPDEMSYDGYIVLQYTAPVKADLFAMESATPANGTTVEMLDVINVTFGNPNYTPMFPGQSQSVGGFDSSKEVVLLNAAGEVVTKASMEAVQVDGWNTNEVKFTLNTPVAQVGDYTLVIPAGTVYNEMYYEYAEDFGASNGALYNPEVRLEYSVGTTIECYPALGEIPATTETITLTFSKEIQSVNVAVLQSTMGELPMLTEDDYFFWGNELSINLPIEYTAKMTDLTVILQVMDVDGYPVTFSNSEHYGKQPGMIFLSYTLAPVTPEIVEFSPELGAMDATERSIYLSFNTPIAEIEVLQLQSSTGELPALEADKDYFLWGKDLSIVLPIEYTAKMSDLLLILKAKDIQGKYVTYSNFEQYNGVPDMVFLYYTLNSVTPELVDLGSNTITSATKSLELMFTTPIAEVETVVLQSSMGEFPPMVEGEGYSVYDNILTLNLPEEYLSKVNDLTVILKVKDIQGKYVTYHNHSMYPEQEGMIFLEYKVLPVTKVVSITPECAKHDALPTEVVVTFDGDIKAVEYGTIRTNLTGFRGYIMSESDYVIDGNKLTINVPAEFVENQANMEIRMNVLDVNDMYVTYAYDPDYEWEDAIILSWSAPVKADFFNMVSSDPEAGVVEKLDVINVTFADVYETVIGGFDMSKVVVVLNAAGDTVTTATMEAVTDEYDWNTNVAKFTLETPVTEAGEYTFVIPAATVYNEMFYEWSEDFGVEQMGALYNAEVRIAYTIVDPTGINNVTVNGKNEDIYTLDGRKVTNATKGGVYVINGKKVYVK